MTDKKHSQNFACTKIDYNNFTQQLVSQNTNLYVEIVHFVHKLLIRHVHTVFLARDFFIFTKTQIPSQLCDINNELKMTESPTTVHCHFIKFGSPVSKPSANKSCLSHLFKIPVWKLENQI